MLLQVEKTTVAKGEFDDIDWDAVDDAMLAGGKRVGGVQEGVPGKRAKTS